MSALSPGRSPRASRGRPLLPDLSFGLMLLAVPAVVILGGLLLGYVCGATGLL